MPLKHRHPLSPKNTIGNSIPPSPQASQHFSITATLNTGSTQKVGVFPRPLSHRIYHRLPVNGSRCSRNAGICRRRRTRPEIVFPVTASVTTLFHNRHAKYWKYTESRRLFTTAQPPCVPSTSGQRQTMPLTHWHPLTPKQPDRKLVFPVTASVTTLFHNRHAKYRKYTESRRLSTTAQPPYVPSTSGQRQSMPLETPTSADAEETDRK
jgi:hypothetical protein